MGDQLQMFTGFEAEREAADIEREKALIAEHEANRVHYLDLWVVMRNPRPVSINEAYSGLRRFLTKKGAHFEHSLKSATARALSTLSWNKVVDSVYKQGAKIDLTIWLYLELNNPAWQIGGNMTVPKKAKPGKKQAQPQRRTPYKKQDGSNYIKLIEDAVVKGTGIDDSAHLDVAVKKRHDPADPRIVLLYRVYE